MESDIVPLPRLLKGELLRLVKEFEGIPSANLKKYYRSSFWAIRSLSSSKIVIGDNGPVNAEYSCYYLPPITIIIYHLVAATRF